MKPRKKHCPRKRLRNHLKGARIIFDGNSNNMLDYRQSNGLPLSREAVDVMTGWAWRWKITLGLRCRLGDAVRVPSVELIINQPCKINDLTDFVKEQHEIMALEQPSAWTVEAQTWEVEVLG